MWTEKEVDFITSVGLVSHVELLTLDESYGGDWHLIVLAQPPTPLDWLRDSWNGIRVHFNNNENRPIVIMHKDVLWS